MNLQESLQPLFAAEPDDYDAVVRVHDAWRDILDDDLDALDQFYALYFDTVKAMLSRPSEMSILDRLKSFATSSATLSDLQAYQFINAFSRSSYLERQNARQATHIRLVERHGEHMDLIRSALKRENRQITDRHTPLGTGYWGDIPGRMLGLYYWHLSNGPQADRVRSEAALLIPEFYRTFPGQKDTILLRLLEDHPDAVNETIALIRFYFLERREIGADIMESLFLDMLGYYADRDRFAHKNGKTIVAGVMADIENWPAETVNDFAENALLKPLCIETISQQQAVEEQRRTVTAYRRMLTRPFRGSRAFSAEQEKTRSEEYLREAEAELKSIETSFDTWLAKRRDRALKRIAVSATTRTILQAAVKRLPDPQRTTVRNLLDAAVAEKQKRVKRFPMPDSTDNRFSDFGLKLLVIEELMYRQELLKPKFDVREFAKEYDGREISVESDGYEVIPEVEVYFRDLAIPDDLLSKVESLHQSSGLDGGSEFISHLYPFWDPGSGDEVIPIGPQAIRDLELLPNLKRISGLENSKPGTDLLAALKARGVELIDEETASF